MKGDSYYDPITLSDDEDLIDLTPVPKDDTPVPSLRFRRSSTPRGEATVINQHSRLARIPGHRRLLQRHVSTPSALSRDPPAPVPYEGNSEYYVVTLILSRTALTLLLWLLYHLFYY